MASREHYSLVAMARCIRCDVDTLDIREVWDLIRAIIIHSWPQQLQSSFPPFRLLIKCHSQHQIWKCRGNDLCIEPLDDNLRSFCNNRRTTEAIVWAVIFPFSESPKLFNVITPNLKLSGSWIAHRTSGLDHGLSNVFALMVSSIEGATDIPFYLNEIFRFFYCKWVTSKNKIK